MRKQRKAKVLTHLHIYYEEQTDWFLEKLSNVNSCDWTLYVTYISLSEETIEKIKNFKPDTVFLKVKNIGYDVYPFIQVIKSVNLDDYDVVLKLHTKNSYQKAFNINVTAYIGSSWRDELVKALLCSKSRFRKNIKILFSQKYGMVYSKKLELPCSRLYGLDELLYKENQRLGFSSKAYSFVAGTMFMAKASIFKILQDTDYTDADFNQCKSETGVNNSLAHVYERLLGKLAYENNYSPYLVEKFGFCDFLRYVFDCFVKQNIFSLKKLKLFEKERCVLTIFGHSFHFLGKEKELVFDSGLKEIEQVVKINPSNKTKRIAVFSAFNDEGKITDCTVYRLKKLNRFVDNIIFVTDNPIDENELKKLSDCVSFVKAQRHGMQDFGSYKIGYKIAQKLGLLQNAEELVFINDEYYGPLDDFDELFADFEKRNVDFYGLVMNTSPEKYILKVFYMFKNKVFLSHRFERFLNSVKKQNHTEFYAQKYEYKFTRYLAKKGFKYKTFVPKDLFFGYNAENKMLFPYILMKYYNCPIVQLRKTKAGYLRETNRYETIEHVKKHYPEYFKLVEQDLAYHRNKNNK